MDSRHVTVNIGVDAEGLDEAGAAFVELLKRADEFVCSESSAPLRRWECPCATCAMEMHAERVVGLRGETLVLDSVTMEGRTLVLNVDRYSPFIVDGGD